METKKWIQEGKNMNNANLKLRTTTILMLFLVTCSIGVLSIDNPRLLGIGIISLAFLVFNSFTTLYKLIITVAKLQEGKKR